MASNKFIPLLALASLALLACLVVAPSANALSIDTSHNIVRRDHAVLAKKKRSTPNKRCKQRPSSSTPTSTPAAAAAAADPTTQPATTSSSSSPAPSPPSSGGNGGKIGIAWSSGDDPALADWAYGASCVYTWSAYLPSNTYGLEGIPMFWGPDKLGEFQQLVKQGYASHVLGFNEPDISSQSNMDPGYAASLWKQYMNPLKDQGYTIISPATVTGTTWMQSFLSACNGGCIIDIVAMHWYGTSFDELKDSLDAYHTAFNKPIWLTEFACQSFSNAPQCNSDQVYSLMNGIKAYADQTDWLQKIFWFGAMHDMTNVNYLNQLMSSSGAPNALGQLYLS